MDLNAKTAIVTGGAVRLGKAIAIALAEQGVRIGLHYGHSNEKAQETLEEISTRGSKGILIQADLNQPLQAAETILGQAVEAFGCVDILINNAAIFEEDSLVSATEEHWDRHFAVNLKAPFFLTQAFVKQLRPEQSAHIVNITDRRGTRPGKDHLVYTLTKSALIDMTTSLALELAPHVQVNAIAPGAILPSPGKEQSDLDRIAENIPLRRTGTPGEVANAVLYLLCSDFITGEVLHVTGGEHL